ncbi:hypothetical protein AURDEDRAFT_177666 [Auricularia subglabra TFB-10046 SS5]|uniref:Uncharacterized protein n=1 Tax=Auricularia subglabra (strain TFB-10046 / SS5) TaxID=717982 RepID=J0WLQ3_AURST|nr:hypothetical protein AURDEDRAFT_177666 [Auricularia subglabra TFB-10046 SS5]
MAPDSSRQGGSTGSAVAALSLVSNVVREAVDGVPVVKQVVGVLSQILSLAEKGEKNREALRMLAETSFAFAEALPKVLNGQQLEGPIADSLEAVLEIAQSVKPIMARHAAKDRIMRALAYAFTLAPQIERLTAELSNAVRMLHLMISLDTNARVRAGKEIALENAQYDGEFRLIRDCDVTKKDLIFQTAHGDGTVVTKYHHADVDGRVFVVRCTEGAQQAYQRAMAQDLLLKRVS